MHIAARLLPMKAVIEFTSLSRATLYRHIKKGIFPQPIKIGERRVVWRTEDIEIWLSHCSAS